MDGYSIVSDPKHKVCLVKTGLVQTWTKTYLLGSRSNILCPTYDPGVGRKRAADPGLPQSHPWGGFWGQTSHLSSSILVLSVYIGFDCWNQHSFVVYLTGCSFKCDFTAAHFVPRKKKKPNGNRDWCESRTKAPLEPVTLEKGKVVHHVKYAVDQGRVLLPKCSILRRSFLQSIRFFFPQPKPKEPDCLLIFCLNLHRKKRVVKRVLLNCHVNQCCHSQQFTVSLWLSVPRQRLINLPLRRRRSPSSFFHPSPAASWPLLFFSGRFSPRSTSVAALSKFRSPVQRTA